MRRVVAVEAKQRVERVVVPTMELTAMRAHGVEGWVG